MSNMPNHKLHLVSTVKNWYSNEVISVWYRCSSAGSTSLVQLSILDVQSIINQLYSDMLFNRNDCSYKTEKKLDETLRIIRRVFSCHLKWVRLPVAMLPMLPHAEFERNDHRGYALHFTMMLLRT